MLNSYDAFVVRGVMLLPSQDLVLLPSQGLVLLLPSQGLVLLPSQGLPDSRMTACLLHARSIL